MMTESGHDAALEQQIDHWRSYLRHRQAIHPVDVAELEDHLREQIAGLMDVGLDADEACLVAVKRMGAHDTLSREFAREHSDRLWKQLVVLPDGPDQDPRGRRDAMVALLLAVAAGVLVKLPALFGLDLDGNEVFYVRNASLFVLPLLAGYFAWKRGVGSATLRWLALAFVAAIVFANVYPFAAEGSTFFLSALHLPIALWLAGVGVAYAGGR